MRTCIILIITILHFNYFSMGQEVQTDSMAQQQISKLGFLRGRWAGSGWMMDRDGQKLQFTQSENIRFKLDSTLLLIEGVGKSGGIILHHALAVVSYNKMDRNYTFQSYLSNGRNGRFIAELISGKFYWYPNENIRYVINLNEKGQWHEEGQMKRNEDWYQFFEMILDRID